MNRLKKLLVIIVAAGTVGSIHAAEDTPRPGALPALLVSTSGAPVIALTAAPGEGVAGARAVRYAQADAGAHLTRAAAVAPGARASAAATVLGIPVPGMPEPADWMQLLCGFVVVGFIARRRVSFMAG
jgi:hypothetical protein